MLTLVKRIFGNRNYHKGEHWWNDTWRRARYFNATAIETLCQFACNLHRAWFLLSILWQLLWRRWHGTNSTPMKPCMSRMYKDWERKKPSQNSQRTKRFLEYVTALHLGPIPFTELLLHVLSIRSLGYKYLSDILNTMYISKVSAYEPTLNECGALVTERQWIQQRVFHLIYVKEYKMINILVCNNVILLRARVSLIWHMSPCTHLPTIQAPVSWRNIYFSNAITINIITSCSIHLSKFRFKYHS